MCGDGIVEACADAKDQLGIAVLFTVAVQGETCPSNQLQFWNFGVRLVLSLLCSNSSIPMLIPLNCTPGVC